VVDEELHRLVVPVPGEIVQNARRLMGAPRGVDVRAVAEQEIRHVEVIVDDGPRKRRIENLLRDGRARLFESPLHAYEIAHARRTRQIVRPACNVVVMNDALSLGWGEHAIILRR
jgi:hypothetical protein